MEKIDTYAFYNGEYHVVTCHAKTPPECQDRYVFSEKVYENAHLLVPEESIDSYKKATCWSLFKHIYPIGYNPSIITLNPYGSFIYVGESLQLNSYTYPHISNETISWTSDNPDIAQVDDNGKVTALKAGRAVITATKQDGVSAEAVVTVQNISAQTLTLDKTELTLKANESSQLTASILPENTTDKTITWITSNESIAKVDGDGRVTAVAVGNATITAMTVNHLRAECEVTVEKANATGIAIDKEAMGITSDDLEMHVGDVKTIFVSIKPETATDKTVTFKSSSPTVATVDATGKVTALALGETTITITAKSGVTAQITVKVIATPAALITLNKSEATLKATEMLKLEASVTPETTTDKSVTWSTSDANTVNVDKTGLVTAVSVGKATVTATTTNGLKATCAITVAETPASSIFIDKESLGIRGDNLEMRVGDVKTINVSVEPATTTDKTVTFISSNTKVATVDATGKITALSLGNAMLTVTCGNASATCTISVIPTQVESITLNKTELTLKKSETSQLSATVSPTTATNKDVVWKSSDETVATVDSQGLVTAKSSGNAIITATSGDVSASCTVYVNPTQFESIILDKTEINLKRSETTQLSATVSPSTATNEDIIWSSSDTSVATVDENGFVTALNIGECAVKAFAADNPEVSASCKVSVEPILTESLSISPEEFMGSAGDSFTIIPYILPDNADNKELAFSSSNENIAEVNNAGTVYIINEGIAVITVKTTDGSDIEAKCIVAGTSDINDIFSDNSIRCDVYNTTGMLLRKDADREYVERLSKGIYIIVMGNKVTKLSLREN